MLPAAHRLRKSAEFTAVTRAGSRARRDDVLAYVLATGSPEPARCGLIVGKSVGGSVARHRVSRILRAALASIIPALPAGHLVVVRALPGAMSSDDLGEQVQEAVVKASGRAVAASASTIDPP